jgi:hypothetical protein
MDTNAHMIEADGPQIETSEILGFLIKRFSEALTRDNQRVPFLLQGMGLAGLGGDEDLLANYKGLLASSILPPKEIIRRSVGIFQMALERDPDNASSERPREQTEDGHALDEKASRHVMMVALREGRQMLQEQEVRFVRIFEMLGWISLQGDPEWLAEFETVRKTFVNDPEGLIEAGRDILRDALFRRRPSGRVQSLSDM